MSDIDRNEEFGRNPTASRTEELYANPTDLRDL